MPQGAACRASPDFAHSTTASTLPWP